MGLSVGSAAFWDALTRALCAHRFGRYRVRLGLGRTNTLVRAEPAEEAPGQLCWNVVAVGRRSRDKASAAVGFVIGDEVKSLVEGRNFATISTLLPSGQIQTHVVWVDCDDEHILINIEVGFRRYKNV